MSVTAPILAVAFAVMFFISLVIVMTRYKRCPSDKILVVYGRIGSEKGEHRPAKCLHGGGAFIIPVIQDFQFLDLTPMPINIDLQNALSKQNLRVNTPSTFTVAVSTSPAVMGNAAERLLGLPRKEIESLARDIIFGQMRVVIASMMIEEINTDREKLIQNILEGVEVEISKVGLHLINVNIHDITDESGYIDALGQEAAARAINEAKVAVAQKERDGAVGHAEAQMEQRVQVAAADAKAVDGENEAQIEVAESNSKRREQVAESNRKAVAAEQVKKAEAQKETYAAEKEAEIVRAERQKATQLADVIVPANISKEETVIAAQATAEIERTEKRGEADGILLLRTAEADGLRLNMEAEAAGLQAILNKKAEGFKNLVAAAGDSPDQASLLLVTEQLPKLVEEQVKIFSNIDFGKIVVWDSGGNSSGSHGATANFLRGLIGALPAVHDLAKAAGLDLPEYFGSATRPLTPVRDLSEEGPIKPERPEGTGEAPTPDRDEKAKPQTQSPE